MNNKSTGCIISPKDLRDYKYVVSASKEIIELPQEFRLSKIHIKNQGSVGSCVAHSLSSALESHHNDNFSTGWIYGYRPLGYHQGSGMVTREALKTLKNKGAVKNNLFDVNIEMQEAKDAVDNILEQLFEYAKDFKIKSYALLTTIREIKEFLYLNQIPVPIAVLEDGMILDENNIIQLPQKENIRGGHCILVVGWNDKGLIIQNSWGEDWGDCGYAILPYEYTIEEAWAIKFEDNFTTKEEKDNIKKPNYYIIRKIFQKIWDFLSKLFD